LIEKKGVKNCERFPERGDKTGNCEMDRTKKNFARVKKIGGYEYIHKYVLK
jgi:hypothetical protein